MRPPTSNNGGLQVVSAVSQTEVGFIGLGNMGRPMAERLITPGIRLHAYDPNTDALRKLTDQGAVGHTSPASVANSASLVFACLPSAAISEQVALGADGISSGRAVRVYVEMSTVGRRTVLRIADGLRPQGIGMLDAPVSGGPAGAREGTLAIMVAGAADASATAMPFLQRIGGRIFRMGDEVGGGQTMKLVNNLVLACNMAGTFEALVMGAKAGLDAGTMTDVLNASTGCSRVTTDIIPRSVLPGSFDFGAATSIVAKDVALGVAEAQALGVPMWTLEQAARLWRFSAGLGHGASDITTLLPVVASWAGLDWPRLASADERAPAASYVPEPD